LLVVDRGRSLWSWVRSVIDGRSGLSVVHRRRMLEACRRLLIVGGGRILLVLGDGGRLRVGGLVNILLVFRSGGLLIIDGERLLVLLRGLLRLLRLLLWDHRLVHRLSTIRRTRRRWWVRIGRCVWIIRIIGPLRSNRRGQRRRWDLHRRRPPARIAKAWIVIDPLLWRDKT
jgi:hypothetical protein